MIVSRNRLRELCLTDLRGPDSDEGVTGPEVTPAACSDAVVQIEPVNLGRNPLDLLRGASHLASPAFAA
jgi:hypothetical protein